MKKSILVAVTFALSTVLLPACNDSTTTKETTSDTTANKDADHNSHKMEGSGGEHDQMMKKMKAHMDEVKITGDYDLDFANMMIPHHQGAVDMSEMYLAKGRDEKIKGMAQNIINAQKKEIEDLKSMIANHKPVKGQKPHSHDDGSENELITAMKTMMEKMHSMKMSGDADKDFVTMMIPHHQSAIDMAGNEISHGKNVDLKKFAQKVIDVQSQEIREFNDWLAAHK